MNAETENIPNGHVAKSADKFQDAARQLLFNLLVERILVLSECPCDPTMKQERAGQRIAIK